MIRAPVSPRPLQLRPTVLAAAHFACEHLEERLALSGYVFIDYGDNFPLAGSNRVLNTTIQGLRDIADSGTPNDKILGTAIGDSVGFAPTFTGQATFNAAARTITRSAGNFVTQGFLANQQITVSNTASNNGNYIIQSVSTTVLTLTPAAVLANEGPVNATIGPRLDTPISVTRPAYTAAERAQILAVVQRDYRPLDLTVVELTPTAQVLADGRTVSAATSLGDVVNNLRGGNATFRDAYVIAASFIVDPGGPNQNIYNSGGGNSPGSPTLGVSSDLATGTNTHDDVALVFASGIGGNFTNTMNNIAHEAGHCLGMQHSITDTGTNAVTLQLHQAEIMSYQNTNNTSSSMFTRYPMIRGDGNTPVFTGQVVFNNAARTLTSNAGNFPASFSAGTQIQVGGTVSNNGTYTVQTLAANVITLNAGTVLTNETANNTTVRPPNTVNYNDLGPRNTPAGRPTYHDQLANDPNVRANQNLTFVSGTGANDIITITRSGALANISVQAFSAASYAAGTAITVPGLGGTTFTYTVPLTQPLLLYGGDGADRFVLDADLGVQTEVDGMLGTDTLFINGKNAASLTYIPSGTAPAGVDLLPGGGGMTNVISFGGTLISGSTTITFRDFETTGSVQVQDVTALTYRTGGSDDNVTLNSITAGQMRLGGTSDAVGLVPLDFFNISGLTIDTGTNDGAAADDDVHIASNAIAAGLNTITVNTGAGSDVLDVNFAVGNAIPAGGLSYDAGAAAAAGDVLNLRGGSFASEVYTPSGAHSGSIVLDGSTAITYSNLAPVNDTVVVADFTFNGSAGVDLINLVDSDVFNGFDTTQINSGNGTFELVNFANKATVHVAGQNGADVFTVNLTDPADGLSALNLYGEDQTNTGDDNAADRFNITPAPGTLPISVNGGGGTGDVLAVNGSAGSFAVANTTITATGVQPITYGTVERLELSNGTFEVVGNVTTPIHVNAVATLVGTGTASGGITANSSGVVSPGIGGPGVLGSGNLVFAAGSNYTLDLNGTGPGTHDELNVTGTVNLDNTATLSATVGYTSIPGDEIVIIRNDGIDAVVGEFGGGSILNFGGVKFTIDYAYDADGDLAFNDVALIRYGAQLAPDPCDPSEQALFVSATSGNDDVRVVPATGNARGRVLINGSDEGVFQFKGHIYIMGQNGNDTVAITMPSRSGFLYGNTGNDLLLAGNNDSILIGGFGDDILRAGNGKDILIGGVGADLLEAGNGTDILITGATTYDAVSAANRVSLCQVADIWDHGGKPSALGGLLNPGTLIADTDVDTTLGGNGKDYFIARVNAPVLDILDADKQETILNI